MVHQTWPQRPVKAQQSENRRRFFPDIGSLARHRDRMKGEAVASDLRAGAAWRSGHVNLKAQVASRMDQFHAVSAESFDAVVNEHDSWLIVHLRAPCDREWSGVEEFVCRSEQRPYDGWVLASETLGLPQA